MSKTGIRFWFTKEQITTFQIVVLCVSDERLEFNRFLENDLIEHHKLPKGLLNIIQLQAIH